MAINKVRATVKPTKRQGTTPTKKRVPKLTKMLELFLGVEQEAKDASSRKSAALSELLAATEHGQLVSTSDGVLYAMVNTKVDSLQHKEVLGMVLDSDAFTTAQKKQITKWLEETKRQTSQRRVKKLG